MEFSQFALLLVFAGFFGILAKFLKQPPLIGYLFAGIFLTIFKIISDTESLQLLGQIGVTLLLFLLGLEMNLRELPVIGKTALLVGLGQIASTFLLGFFFLKILNFNDLPAVYMAIALTFSSTIIIVKLLSEKKDVTSLYGRIAIGFLLVQDLVAILLIMFLGGIGREEISILSVIPTFVKGFLLLGAVWFLSKKILVSFFERIAGTSTELMFTVSLAWALGVAAFVLKYMGFSLEIGGFLAGLALSGLPEHLQIASRTKPLRDFFLTIFFLLLGTQLFVTGQFLSTLPVAIVLSLFVLIIHPVAIFSILGFLGYKRRTSFLVGLSSTQISEFSFIMMSVGLSLKHVSEAEASLVIVVGIITMTTSTYLILASDKIYSKVKDYLGIFERKITKESVFMQKTDSKKHIVLVGCDRSGRVLAKYFTRKKFNFLVVDFNPSVYKKLTAENIPVIFGDINDPEIQTATNLSDASLIISTPSNFADNLTLLEYIRQLKSPPVTIVTASTKLDAVRLYEMGATYVIVPEIVAGDYIKHLFKTPGMGANRLTRMGKNHFDRLLTI